MRLLLDQQRKLISSLNVLANGDSVLVLDAINLFGLHDADAFRKAVEYILVKAHELPQAQAQELVEEVVKHFELDISGIDSSTTDSERRAAG